MFYLGLRAKLPQNIGEVVHSFMMATHATMSAKENVALIKVMEDNNIAVAKQRNYRAVFTTNTSETTRVSENLKLLFTI